MLKTDRDSSLAPQRQTAWHQSLGAGCLPLWPRPGPGLFGRGCWAIRMSCWTLSGSACSCLAWRRPEFQQVDAVQSTQHRPEQPGQCHSGPSSDGVGLYAWCGGGLAVSVWVVMKLGSRGWRISGRPRRHVAFVLLTVPWCTWSAYHLTQRASTSTPLGERFETAVLVTQAGLASLPASWGALFRGPGPEHQYAWDSLRLFLSVLGPPWLSWRAACRRQFAGSPPLASVC